ncbi:hypothetical protein EZV62_003709 [Acer yangbiense]|uniref:Malectin-like domain-containing protein n=1 Tax=Acer yangbiense TaxID=1000413 RepID=A0A5C7IIM0_9ROSI|nr:hypothetical protein EZV62_003709 [Acer yangbiense]
MGVKSTGAWGSVAWFMFVISFWKISAYCGDQSAVFSASDQHSRRKLDDIEAAISIDCGTLAGYSYIDDNKTELKYTSDEGYINTGVNRNIASKYGDDRYDRMWFPYQGFKSIKTSSTTDTLVESEYRLPPAVMTTAVRPINVNESLEFSFDTKDPILKFDVYMHFAELENLQENQSRKFNIELNGNLWEESVVPKNLSSRGLTGRILLALSNLKSLQYLYYTSNRLTEKSDVYSFGIVLLELITGQRAVIKGHENTHIARWVCPFLERGDIRSIIDPRLGENFDTNSIWKAVETAMVCVPDIPIKRPTMSHVVTELKECLEMEIARDQQTRRLESLMSKSINSIDMSPVDLETEKGPQPR